MGRLLQRQLRPHVGHQLYTRYLSEMVLADRLGYDGIVLNEHHNTQYSMNPAPNLTAAALIPQTSGWVSVFGTPPNLGYPNRLAEEYAMLDVCPAGGCAPPSRSAPAWSTGPTRSTRRLPGPASASRSTSSCAAGRCRPAELQREFYTYRYLNPWPRPIQQPYPECYIVGTGSPETIELAAELGFGYTVVFIPTKVQLQVFDHYRERLAHHGHEPTPDKVTIGVMAYVAESDERAGRRSSCPMSCTSSRTTCAPRRRIPEPARYVTVPEFRKRITGADVHGSANWDDLVSLNRIVAGTPEKVAHAVGQWIEEAGSSCVNLNLTLGDMPNWKVVKNTTLFAEEVIPRLRTRKVGRRGRAQRRVPAGGGTRDSMSRCVRAPHVRRQRNQDRRPRRRRSGRPAAGVPARRRHVPRLVVRRAVDGAVPRPPPTTPGTATPGISTICATSTTWCSTTPSCSTSSV